MASCAVISDVHANLEALTAVLNNIDEERIDLILFLGDSIGYGPDPDACLDVLRTRADVLLAGNHDQAAVGLTDVRYFNPYARRAIEWTCERLSSEQKQFLRSLPLTAVQGGMFLVHGTPRLPERWEYLLDEDDARVNFGYFDEQVCFVGHSHIPFIMERTPAGSIRSLAHAAALKPANRYIINAGSVGQPRDGNPEAAYVIVRDRKVLIKRTAYDIVKTQKKMRKARLPEYLIERLSLGR